MLKKTKIICTLGPASADYQNIKKLALAGMNVARLNFSHGDHAEKRQKIELVRKVSQDLDLPIAIMADMSGPKIRLGLIDGRFEIEKSDEIILTLNPTSPKELPMQFDLSPFVKKGQRIFLNDGLVELIVERVKGKVIETRAQNSGWVSSHKGINIPDTRLKDFIFTEKDMADGEFALNAGVDYLAVSFIQGPEDMDPALKLIKKINLKTKIVVKLEKNEAVNYLEEIVRKADVVMVARGDLAIEAKASEVPIIQQKIIKLCRQYRRPVIVATQMLESMIENPRPTRAEVSDVANAVLDQVDAVMLSAESASGKYPVEAVEIMSDVISSVEQHPDYKHYIKINWEQIGKDEVAFSAIASSAASLAYRIAAKTLVVATATGSGARRLTSFRPDASIIAITHDEQTKRQLNLVWGVTPFVVKPKTHDSDTFWSHILKLVKDKELVKKGEKVVLVGGTSVGVTGATDTIKVVTI